MATTTKNLALIKPAGTDKIRIAQINSNMDVLDAKIGPVGNTSLQEQLNNKQGALTFDSAPTSGSTNPVTSGGIYNAEQSVRNTVAIVATGNTAPKAINAGEFVQWKGAVYTATANIPSGGTLSTSNLQAVPNGGLNALKSRVDTLNSNFVNSIGKAKITIIGDNLTTFSIPISNRNPNVFMAFLVVRRDNLYPAIWVLGVGTGASPTVAIKQVLTMPGAALTNATISDGTLTLTFSTTAYGGIAVIQL